MLFIRQRTMTINAVRAHLAEFGIVAGIDRNGLMSFYISFGTVRNLRYQPKRVYPSPPWPTKSIS